MRNILILTALGLVLAPLPGAAYVRTTTIETGTTIRWMYTNCVYVRANSVGSDDVTDGSDIVAIKRSMDNWLNGTKHCSYMKFSVLEESKEAVPAFDKCGANENTIYFEEKDWGNSVKPTNKGYDRSALALTRISFIEKEGHAQDGRVVDADIEFNGVHFKFATNGDKKKADIENTLTHELGHLLGLDHPCSDAGTKAKNINTPKDHTGKAIPSCASPKLSKVIEDCTMYNYADDGETKKRSPEADDINGVCAMYPLASAPSSCRQSTLDCDEGGCNLSGGSSSTPLPSSRWLLMPLLLLLGLFVAARCRA